VFGASDEVLGTIEGGVDFEKRILAIYQQCRTPAEIEAAFAKLRAEMDDLIRARMDSTRQTLLEHFDEDVHTRLRLQLDDARAQLDRVGQMFWALTRFMLAEHATFDDTALTFDLTVPPQPEVRLGRYHLISKSAVTVPSEFLYRLSHPLGEHVLTTAQSLPVPLAHLTFDLSHHATRISALESLRGQGGWLTLQAFAIEAFEREEYALFSGFTDAGSALDQETCEKLFRCAGTAQPLPTLPPDVDARLARETERYVQATLARSLEANNRAFQQEREKLDRWADDMIFASEKALADTKAQIKLLERQARLAATTDEQLTLQSKIAELERVKRRQRQQIFEVEDDIKAKRDALITALERRLAQRTERATLFTVRWTIA
jgi:exonuclease VII large subunit